MSSVQGDGMKNYIIKHTNAVFYYFFIYCFMYRVSVAKLEYGDSV